MIRYNLWECCNLHLYSRTAFQHASLLKAPLPFHQQNKQKRKSTYSRIETTNAVPVFFLQYEKCRVGRMRLQIIHNIQSNSLHFTYTCYIFLFKHFAYLLLQKINLQWILVPIITLLGDWSSQGLILYLHLIEHYLSFFFWTTIMLEIFYFYEWK